jgi:hypothetical protein
MQALSFAAISLSVASEKAELLFANSRWLLPVRPMLRRVKRRMHFMASQARKIRYSSGDALG